MSQAPIMPFFTDAYLADCHHLSTEAHGALLLILLHTWRLNAKPLPDDDRIMMRIVKARSITRWHKLKSELAPFFDLTEGSWRQKKLERTWADVAQKIETNRSNAKLRHSPEKRDKPPKYKDSPAATAADSHLPSINHEPDPNLKPTILKKEDDMIIATNYPSKGALEALTPVLHDPRYFIHRTEYHVSPQLRPQIEAAIEEIDAQLAPAPAERIEQIVMRLMLHFPTPSGTDKHRLCTDYADMLQDFPEDMLCAAYQHVLKHHKYHTLPKIADLLAFMEPEITRRRTVRRKLDILHKQTQVEELA